MQRPTRKALLDQATSHIVQHPISPHQPPPQLPLDAHKQKGTLLSRHCPLQLMFRDRLLLNLEVVHSYRD